MAEVTSIPVPLNTEHLMSQLPDRTLVIWEDAEWIVFNLRFRISVKHKELNQALYMFLVAVPHE